MIATDLESPTADGNANVAQRRACALNRSPRQEAGGIEAEAVGARKQTNGQTSYGEAANAKHDLER